MSPRGAFARLALVAILGGSACLQAAPSPSAFDGPGRAPVPFVSLSAVTLPAPDRGEPLQVRVSAPAAGRDLPIIVFAHGNALSSRDYAPLADFWAAHGFVVIQPTFLDSAALHLSPDDPRTPLIWRFRVSDMKRVIDDLRLIEAAVPGLAGRIDPSRIAVAGHSYGGITAAMLLGARVVGPNGPGEDLSDPRVKVGILLSTPGHGGKDLSAFAAKAFPFMNPGFSTMIRPALVVAGDMDQSPLTTRGPDWFTDPYTLSPGPKCLVTLFGGKHGLGGISGYGVAVTTDEKPERVTEVQRLSTAYLRTILYPGDDAWSGAKRALTDAPHPEGRAECK